MNEDSLQSLIAQTFLREWNYYAGALDGFWGPVSKRAAVQWSQSPGFIVVGDSEYLRALAAQRQLAKQGFYTGALDGEWGPLSKAAALAWQAAQRPEPKPLPSQDRPGWTLPYDIAKQYLGTREIPGKENNPLIVRWLRKIASWISDDETAWCAAFVNFCAEEAGYEKTGKLNARSFLDIGEEIPLSAARKGDVIILWRVSKDSWQGHVAFLDHHNPTRGLLYLLGGNQGNMVNITAYGVSQLLGVRRLRSLDALQGNSGNRLI